MNFDKLRDIIKIRKVEEPFKHNRLLKKVKDKKINKTDG